MSKITWPNRTDLKTAIGATYEWAAAIANEVKDSINTLYSDKNTWYVATSGDESNIGSTKAEPFKNIQAAHDAASANDTILIQNIDFSESDNFNISKTLLIKGPAGYNESETAKITGQFTITNGANLIFENINLEGITIVSSVGDTKISIRKSLLRLVAATDSAVDLSLRETKLQLFSGIKLRTLTMNDSDGGGSDLEVSREAELLNGSFFSGNLDVGLDVAASLNLRNSTIEGNISTTLNLSKFNSVITGTETVSGSTTETGQADDKLDRLSASDQTVASNVEFLKQVTGKGNVISFDATPNFSFNNGNAQQMPVEGDVTSFVVSNEKTPGNYDVYLVNDGTAGRTVAAPTGWTADSTSETHTTAADAINRYQFYTMPDGSKYFNLHIVKS